MRAIYRHPISDKRLPEGYHLERRTVEVSGEETEVSYVVCRKNREEVGTYLTQEHAVREALRDSTQGSGGVRILGTKTLPARKNSCERYRERHLCFWCDNGNMDFRGLSCCPQCQGTGELTVDQMLQTYDGTARLAEMVAPMIAAGGQPVWWREMLHHERVEMEILIKNPCAECDSHLLDPHWKGTGFCSRNCVVRHAPKNWEFCRGFLE